jgi:SAM-dependent methyltransferase
MWQRNSPPPPGQIDFGELRQPQLFRCDVNYSQDQALDQYYVEQFLRREMRLMKRRVLEIGSDHCTPEFAGSRTATITSIPFAQETQVLHDLAVLKDNTYDALVMVQVLQFMFDLHAVLKHAHRVLIPGGILLAAMPGTCYVPNHVDGRMLYWGFTGLSVRTLLGSTFPARSIKIQSFGNVFVATAHVQHLAAQDLTRTELNHRDEHYPFILTFKAEKLEQNSLPCDQGNFQW